MNKRELLEYKELLLKHKQKLLEEIRHITKGASTSHKDASGGISTYTYHMADVASDHYEREMSLNIATTEQKLLNEIDEALKRIADKSFGDCLDCEKPIPPRRLKAIPYASLCIACARLRETRPRA